MSRFLVPTRWRLFSLLFLLSFLSYLMRQNIHVAGEFMMPELGISEIEMGWIYAAFICCLLYTSPSPRDMRRSRMPSSA